MTPVAGRGRVAGGRPWGTGRAVSRWVAAAAVAGAAGLSGCASPQVDLSEDAAARLQEAVWSTSSAAAQGRLDAAATALERVREELDRAVEDDAISVRRYREVDDALRAVEAELAALRSTSSAAPLPSEEPAAGSPSITGPVPVEAQQPAGDSVEADADRAGSPGTTGDDDGTTGDDDGAGTGRAGRGGPGAGEGGGRDGGPGGAGSGNQGNGVGPDGNRGRGRG